MILNIEDLEALLAGPQKMVRLTPESPMVVRGEQSRTICMFKHIGRVVQHSFPSLDEEVPEGGQQEFTIGLPVGNDILQFLNNVNDGAGTNFKTIEEFFAGDTYSYSDDKKGAV